MSCLCVLAPNKVHVDRFFDDGSIDRLRVQVWAFGFRFFRL